MIRQLIQKGKSTREIEQACRKHGYQGSWAAQERRREKENKSPPLYLRQKVLYLLWKPPDEEPKKQLVELHPQFSQAFPQVFELYDVIDSFRQILSKKEPERLESWISHCLETAFMSIHFFVSSSLLQDLPAVLNGIREPWSNGLEEGHINKLKLIKRSIYGRAHFPLLRIKLLLAQ